MQKLYHFLHRCLMQFHLDYYRVLHSFKTALGCLIGLGLVWYLKWPSGQWVPITVMVVMSAQPHFGGAVQKATMRFLGTAAGVMITLLTLIALHDNIVAVFIVIFLACLFFTYIASSGGNISYAGTLGGVTVILTLTATQATPLLAIQRGFHIVIGIVIALLVSRFVFPIHAREALRFSIARVLRRLKRMYFETVSHSVQDATLSHEMEVLYRKIVRQEELLEEAKAGSFYFRKYRAELFTNIIGSERKLYRLINLMGKSLVTGQQIQVVQQIKGLDDFHQAIEQQLEKFAVYFEKAQPLEGVQNINSLLQEILLNAKQLPNLENLQLVLQEHSYLFFLEEIVHELAKVQSVVSVLNST